MPVIICLLLLWPINAFTQTSLFTDSRDGQQYPTITVNGRQWFRENLRFATQKSFYPNFSKDTSGWWQGNYYSNSELGKICPPGWHVATIADWESYISNLPGKHTKNNGVLQYDTLIYKEDKNYRLNMSREVLWADTLLRLQSSGWVEGLKLKKTEGLNLWITDTATNDDKYHLHIGVLGYVKHTHRHHIEDKPSKVRKFPVRCVCDVKSE